MLPFLIAWEYPECVGLKLQPLVILWGRILECGHEISIFYVLTFSSHVLICFFTSVIMLFFLIVSIFLCNIVVLVKNYYISLLVSRRSMSFASSMFSLLTTLWTVFMDVVLLLDLAVVSSLLISSFWYLRASISDHSFLIVFAILLFVSMFSPRLEASPGGPSSVIGINQTSYQQVSHRRRQFVFGEFLVS